MRSSETQIKQQVTFQGCLFEDIEFGGNLEETATMVKATHPANTVTFRECIFRNIQRPQQVWCAVLCLWFAILRNIPHHDSTYDCHRLLATLSHL